MRLQEKIDSDLKAVEEREKSLEKKAKEIAKRESEISDSGDRERLESIVEKIEEIEEKMGGIGNIVRSLNDSSVWSLTMEGLQSIYSDLAKRFSDVKKNISEAIESV